MIVLNPIVVLNKRLFVCNCCFAIKMADFSKRSLNNYNNETFNYNSKFYFIAQWSVV